MQNSVKEIKRIIHYSALQVVEESADRGHAKLLLHGNFSDTFESDAYKPPFVIFVVSTHLSPGVGWQLPFLYRALASKLHLQNVGRHYLGIRPCAALGVDPVRCMGPSPVG